VIAKIQDQTMIENTVTSMSFTVTDMEDNPCHLTITFASSNPSLMTQNNMSYMCNAGIYTLTITPAVDQSGTAMITVTVKDSANATDSESFMLTVTANTKPQITGLKTNAWGTNSRSPQIPFSLYDKEGGIITLGISSSTSMMAITISGGSVNGSSPMYTVSVAAGESKTLTLTIRSAEGASISDTSAITLVAMDHGGLTGSSTLTYQHTENLSVRFANMSVINTEDAHVIEWQTTSEIDTAGFYVQRSDSLNGPFTTITNRIIPAQVSMISGATYTYTDRLADPQKVYYYRIVEIDLQGNEIVYPIKNAVSRESNEEPPVLIYDANNDGKEDLADIIYLLQLLTNFQPSQNNQ
jgi:hypothetical protein